MKKLDDGKMASLLEAGYERRNLEFKEGFAWDDQPSSIWMQEKVTRAVLAMTNTREGGQIVIGIQEVTDADGNKTLNFAGVTSKQLASFENYDRIKGIIDGFSSSDTNFDIGWGEHKTKPYVIITVREFYDIPVICRKDGQKKVLFQHDIYTRSKRSPYASIKTTDLELREIIKMATAKEKEEAMPGQQELLAAQRKQYDDQAKELL